MPSGAESPQLLPAPPSTKPLPAAFVQLKVHHLADLVSFFRQEGQVFFLVRESQGIVPGMICLRG